MEFLKRMFGSRHPPHRQGPERARQTFAVVGESQYQRALERICGGRPKEPADHPCRARLVPEPTNKYDPNAIMVQVDGMTVGYLSRGAARKYAPIAALLSEPLECAALIVGGWRRSAEDQGSFGIRLDLPIASELLATVKARAAGATTA